MSLSSRLRSPILALLALFALMAGVPARADEGEAAHTSMVLSMVTGIIHYTRWPALGAALRACLAGQSNYFAKFPQISGQLENIIDHPVVFVDLTQPENVTSECDLVYVGAYSDGDTQKIVELIARRPILSIGEHKAFCSLGGMFCLNVEGVSEPVSFAVNLDAISRSTVRVNPQVLRLGVRLREKAGR